MSVRVTTRTGPAHRTAHVRRTIVQQRLLPPPDAHEAAPCPWRRRSAQLRQTEVDGVLGRNAAVTCGVKSAYLSSPREAAVERLQRVCVSCVHRRRGGGGGGPRGGGRSSRHSGGRYSSPRGRFRPQRSTRARRVLAPPATTASGSQGSARPSLWGAFPTRDDCIGPRDCAVSDGSHMHQDMDMSQALHVQAQLTVHVINLD